MRTARGWSCGAALLALAGTPGCGPGEVVFDAGPLPVPDPSPIDCPGLSVSGVTPPSGPVGVDRVLAISGSGFNNGATVEFVQAGACMGGGGGGIPATDVVVLSPTQIVATFPAPSGGFWDVRVTRGGTDACATTVTARSVFRAAPTTAGNFAECLSNVSTIDNMGVQVFRVVPGDFNCDCAPDVILALRGASNLYLEGRPDGTLNPAMQDGAWDLVLRSGVAIGTGLTEEMIAVDLDADGDDDIVTAVGGTVADGGGLHLFENRSTCPGTSGGAPVFVERTGNLPKSRSVMKDVAAGDLDGDGRPDLIGVAGTVDEGLILLNRGGFEFSVVEPGVNPRVLVTGGAHDAVVVDLDLDGLGDIVASSATPGTGADNVSEGVVLLNTGMGFVDATMSCGLDSGFNPKLKETMYFVGAGDLDLDGDPDIVMDSTAGSYHFINGATTAGPGVCSFVRNDVTGLFNAFDSGFTMLEDIDTDGDLDVWNGDAGFARNDGGALDSSWPAAAILPTGGNLDHFGAAAVDLNDDGILDLVGTQSSAPFVLCYLQTS